MQLAPKTILLGERNNAAADFARNECSPFFFGQCEQRCKKIIVKPFDCRVKVGIFGGNFLSQCLKMNVNTAVPADNGIENICFGALCGGKVEDGGGIEPKPLHGIGQLALICASDNERQPAALINFICFV